MNHENAVAEDRSSSATEYEYTSGLYEPVSKEIDGDDLDVIGTIPRRINGMFLQNMPNPAFQPGPGHSWFDGDGMVHSVQMFGGRAKYRNRYIHTRGLAEDRAAKRATYVGSLAAPGKGNRHKNVANTDLILHAGRLLALWWEGGEVYELSLPELVTLGTFDYGGSLKTGMTSHAKLDPKTGELFYIAWGHRKPYLTIGVAGENGQILRSVPVDLPGPRIQHDMALSERYVCVFDFPLAVDLSRNGSHLGFRMAPDQPSRIGLLSRNSPSNELRWFDARPCYMWHVMCAWDEGDEFVLLGARSAEATNTDAHGKAHDDRPLVDGEHRFDSYLYEWRLNTRDGSVRERVVDDQLIEFPRVSDTVICSGAKFGYAAAIDPSARTLRAIGLSKYDLKDGYRRTDLRFPANSFGYEATFVPADDAVSEDDGYVVHFVTNMNSGTSELWLTHSQQFAQGPVAKIQLPQRVPPGFHGRWIPHHKITKNIASRS